MPKHKTIQEYTVVPFKDCQFLYKIISTKTDKDGNKLEDDYLVNTETKVCSCPGWHFGNRRDKKGLKRCKHLDIAEGIK